MSNKPRPCARCGGRLDPGAHKGLCVECRVEERRPVYERLESLWAEGMTYDEIAVELGESKHRTTSLVTAARNAGFDLRRRHARPAMPEKTFKATAKEFKRELPRPVVANPPRGLSDRMKTVIRVLKAVPEPLSARDLADYLERLPRSFRDFSASSLYIILPKLRAHGLVKRVPAPRGNGYSPKYLWLVPATAESVVLTLEDAQQEKELAALIAAQEREQRRGHWAETDHKAAFSLDAPIKNADGGSWHDLLEDVA